MSLSKDRKMKPFNELLGRLDESTVKKIKLNADDLLDILLYCKDKDDCLKELTEERRRTWFQLIGRVGSADIDDSELIVMVRLVEQLQLNPILYYPKFYLGWELLMLEKLTTQELLNVLDVYTHWNVDLPEEIFDKWCDLSGDNFSSVYTSGTCCQALFYLGRLKLKPDRKFLDPCLKKVMGSLSGLNPEQLAYFVYAYGKLSLDIPQSDIERIATKMEASYKKFDPTAYIMTMYGFALSKTFPVNILRKWLDDYYLQVGAKLKERPPSGISRSMWSVVKLRRLIGNSPEQFKTKWYEATPRRLGDFQPDSLHLVLETMFLSQDEPTDPKAFWSAWINRSEKVLEQFWPEAFAKILTRLHRCKVTIPKNFLKNWYAAAPKLMSQMYAEDMVELLRGLYDHKVESRDISRQFMESWQQEAVMKSYYFPRDLSFEIKDLFNHWELSIHGNLLGKLHD